MKLLKRSVILGAMSMAMAMPALPKMGYANGILRVEFSFGHWHEF